MKWDEYTLFGRVIVGLFVWFLLAPFFAGLVLGHAGFLEGAFWSLMIAAWVAVPLMLFVSAVLDRRLPAAPEFHGPFALGERKRTVTAVSRLDHRMSWMPPEELANHVARFKLLCDQLKPIIGENCSDCGHVHLELDSSDGERIAVLLSLETPRLYRRTRGIGFFAVETRAIEVAP
jgi:hypothetical protein